MTKKFLIREWERAQKETVTRNGKMVFRWWSKINLEEVSCCENSEFKPAKTGVMEIVGHLDVMRYQS